MAQQKHRDADADASFERLLLRSASTDPLPHAAAPEAWAKFARASSGVALVAGATLAEGGLLHAARRARLTWLALGAIGGSAITAAWLATRSAATTARIPLSSPSAAAAPPSTPSAQRSGAEVSLALAPSLEPDAKGPLESAARPPLAQRQPPTKPAVTPKQQEIPTSSASSLAAEVAALDAVHQAIATRDFSRALRLVAEYHSAFPRAQLAPDADALAIEALEASGDRNELARRAARFLSQYPNDPHAARIEASVER